MSEIRIPLVASTNGSFDLQTIAETFPEQAETMLLDLRLTDEPSASSRLFRIYTRIPAHFHKLCDEYLVVISGRAEFFVGDSGPIELSPDTPRRDPSDVHFVDPGAGTPETFIQTLRY